MENGSKGIREWAEQAQKCANAALALADAEDAEDQDAIEKATKDFLFETIKFKILGS